MIGQALLSWGKQLTVLEEQGWSKGPIERILARKEENTPVSSMPYQWTWVPFADVGYQSFTADATRDTISFCHALKHKQGKQITEKTEEAVLSEYVCWGTAEPTKSSVTCYQLKSLLLSTISLEKPGCISTETSSASDISLSTLVVNMPFL